jgi:hypothetical protein
VPSFNAFPDRYLAGFTIRRDGSSRFGQDNRYVFFLLLLQVENKQ